MKTSVSWGYLHVSAFSGLVFLALLTLQACKVGKTTVSELTVSEFIYLTCNKTTYRYIALVTQVVGEDVLQP